MMMVVDRTGAGGGHKENDKVEYIRRHSDSDDELDDFGRRAEKGGDG